MGIIVSSTDNFAYIFAWDLLIDSCQSPPNSRALHFAVHNLCLLHLEPMVFSCVVYGAPTIDCTMFPCNLYLHIMKNIYIYRYMCTVHLIIAWNCCGHREPLDRRLPVKKRWRFRKIFVAFSEYMNFIRYGRKSTIL